MSDYTVAYYLRLQPQVLPRSLTFFLHGELLLSILLRRLYQEHNIEDYL